MTDLSVDLGGLAMATPVTTASGTFGYGVEYAGAVDYSKLGAVTVKGIRLDPWPGNPMPRHVEVPGGLVNAIGLQGPGVKDFLSVHVRRYIDIAKGPNGYLPPLIVNIWGGSVEEYAEVAARLSEFRSPAAKNFPEWANRNPQFQIGAIEMNVSCPNVKAGGHTFGQDPKVLSEVVGAVRSATDLPLIVKLAPNVPSIAPYAKVCEDAGANAIALINTIPAMVIDVEKRRPVLGNLTGGLSGRGIHPAAVKVVYDAHKATRLPILAMGGVYEAKDALEFFLAGATAVAVGTALFTDPSVPAKVCDGIAEYCERHGFASVRDLVGALEL